MLDLKITSGTLVDGTGAPGRGADVGVAGEAVAAVGDGSNRARSPSRVTQVREESFRRLQTDTIDLLPLPDAWSVGDVA